MHFGVAGTEPRTRYAQRGARDLREAQDVAVERERACEIADRERHVAHAAGNHARPPRDAPVRRCDTMWTGYAHRLGHASAIAADRQRRCWTSYGVRRSVR